LLFGKRQRLWAIQKNKFPRRPRYTPGVNFVKASYSRLAIAIFLSVFVLSRLILLEESLRNN
jgi:hypothetical protein